LLGQLEERAEVFEFANYAVLGGDQLVGAFGAIPLALVVRSVPGRALLLGGKLGFELLDPCLQCGKHLGHWLAARLVATRTGGPLVVAGARDWSPGGREGKRRWLMGS
jgi:hypothetical protein